MTSWQLLVTNFAVVALVQSGWVHGQFLLRGRSKSARHFAFGVTMGLGAIATMALAVRTETGGLLDLRSTLIALAGFFGGPIAALVSSAIAIAYRLTVAGGSAWTGALIIIIAALVGIAVSRATRGRLPALWSAGVLAVAVACIVPAISFTLSFVGQSSLSSSTLLLALLNGASTALSATFIIRLRVIERERDLLRAAFSQSPDFQYVKDTGSRFVAVNRNVVKHHGYDDAKDMLGKSDLDLTDRERARELIAAEQRIVSTGEPQLDRLETLSDMTGREYCYLTTKVPLHNGDGEIVGIAGVTRDVTQQKQLERQVVESRNQLSYVLREMSDGVAMFSQNGTLLYCNERYRAIFPLTAHIRRPGANIREILREAIKTGEELVPAGGDVEGWIERIVEGLRRPVERELELADGRWLTVRAQPTTDGGTLTVLADVTQLKKSESALRLMTEQLKLLASTDGLTGLVNRRAFDTALEGEMARARRTNLPLSLLMIDVDRFKAYNDLYGHQAGDEVLKSVGAALKDALRRPGDVAARYGGEEFVALLPDTDEDGAFFIADAFRERLHDLKIAHKGSEKGFVTVSVGLSTLTDRDGGMNANGLVRRADEALYNAKGAGRDRVTGWRPRHEVRPVGGIRA
jgi:diguanylate cyclase (GGDEF)-like protein/PAS domain S-box-containing protein